MSYIYKDVRHKFRAGSISVRVGPGGEHANCVPSRYFVYSKSARVFRPGIIVAPVFNGLCKCREPDEWVREVERVERIQTLIDLIINLSE